MHLCSLVSSRVIIFKNFQNGDEEHYPEIFERKIGAIFVLNGSSLLNNREIKVGAIKMVIEPTKMTLPIIRGEFSRLDASYLEQITVRTVNYFL